MPWFNTTFTFVSTSPCFSVKLVDGQQKHIYSEWGGSDGSLSVVIFVSFCGALRSTEAAEEAAAAAVPTAPSMTNVLSPPVRLRLLESRWTSGSAWVISWARVSCYTTRIPLVSYTTHLHFGGPSNGMRYIDRPFFFHFFVVRSARC